MRLRRDDPASDPLSDQMRQILIAGPQAVKLTYHDLPPHEELRALWRVHGAALKQAHRGRLWFEDREEFFSALHSR